MSNIFSDFHKKDDHTTQKEREYSRIMTAAVINERFRKLLLTNPGLALKSGYGGEAFHLAIEESTRIAAIRAASLADFAKQMNGFSQRAGIVALAAE